MSHGEILKLIANISPHAKDYVYENKNVETKYYTLYLQSKIKVYF
jgi:hypothetical protein